MTPQFEEAVREYLAGMRTRSSLVIKALESIERPVDVDAIIARFARLPAETTRKRADRSVADFQSAVASMALDAEWHFFTSSGHRYRLNGVAISAIEAWRRELVNRVSVENEQIITGLGIIFAMSTEWRPPLSEQFLADLVRTLAQDPVATLALLHRWQDATGDEARDVAIAELGTLIEAKRGKR